MAKLSSPYINEIMQRDVQLGQLLQRHEKAINKAAASAGVAPVGEVSAPLPPNGVTVKASGEMVHIAVNDQNALSRVIQYHTEYANDSAFTQPWVIDHGSSRNHTITLPTKNDDGSVTHNWFFRSYSQYAGSKPSAYTVYGGAASPTAIVLTGSTQLTLPSSNGSGTASPNGSQGGQGLGVFSARAAQGPKRNLGSK
jgi:hypothetical protein